MKVVALTATAGALFAALAGGCGHDPAATDHVDRLRGHDVATMAERELEAENPRLAAGTMRCPDLDFRVGAAVHCQRTAELAGGRVVTVPGTVAVTSLASGGRLHVAMADRPAQFGVAGSRLAADLRRWYAQQFHVRPGEVVCPYLPGRVGHQVACRVAVAGVRREVAAIATAVDARDYRTTYVFRTRVD